MAGCVMCDSDVSKCDVCSDNKKYDTDTRQCLTDGIIEPEWSNPQTINLTLLELESGLKCISGQGENSANKKNLVFPTRV